MISKDDIEGLARLARLELASGEAEHLQKEITAILDYVGQVTSLSGAPANQKPALRNVMREDAPHEVSSPVAGKREALLAAFPKKEEGYLVVRKIIQKDAS